MKMTPKEKAIELVLRFHSNAKKPMKTAEKRDWEITAFKSAIDGIWSKSNKGRFTDVSKHGLATEQELLSSKGYYIHSVLRDDGVEFTVGDEVTWNHGKQMDKIIRFSESGCSGDMLADVLGMHISIFKLSKPSKKVLFKTYDGVEVFELDFYFMIHDDGVNKKMAIGDPEEYVNDKTLRFSARENALQYISDNEKLYSKRQILEALETLRDYDQRIVKTKLGIEQK